MKTWEIWNWWLVCISQWFEQDFSAVNIYPHCRFIYTFANLITYMDLNTYTQNAIPTWDKYSKSVQRVLNNQEYEYYIVHILKLKNTYAKFYGSTPFVCLEYADWYFTGSFLSHSLYSITRSYFLFLGIFTFYLSLGKYKWNRNQNYLYV